MGLIKNEEIMSNTSDGVKTDKANFQANAGGGFEVRETFPYGNGYFPVTWFPTYNDEYCNYKVGFSTNNRKIDSTKNSPATNYLEDIVIAGYSLQSWVPNKWARPIGECDDVVDEGRWRGIACIACYENCYDACNGCFNLCVHCTSGCTSACTSACTTGCTAACQTCTGGCTSGVGYCPTYSCTFCTGSCQTSCATGCTGGCHSQAVEESEISIGTTINGCDSGCTSGCTNGCTASCASTSVEAISCGLYYNPSCSKAYGSWCRADTASCIICHSGTLTCKGTVAIPGCRSACVNEVCNPCFNCAEGTGCNGCVGGCQTHCVDKQGVWHFEECGNTDSCGTWIGWVGCGGCDACNGCRSGCAGCASQTGCPDCVGGCVSDCVNACFGSCTACAACDASCVGNTTLCVNQCNSDCYASCVDDCVHCQACTTCNNQNK